MVERAGFVWKHYSGVIRDKGMPVWICKHDHPSRREAQECAIMELGTRTLARRERAKAIEESEK